MTTESAARALARKNAQDAYPGHQVKIDGTGAVLVRESPLHQWTIVDFAPPDLDIRERRRTVREWFERTLDGTIRVVVSLNGDVMANGRWGERGNVRYLGKLDDCYAQATANPKAPATNKVHALRKHYGGMRDMDIKADGTVFIADKARAGAWESHGTIAEAYARIAPKT